jgi:hypothetical protein
MGGTGVETCSFNSAIDLEVYKKGIGFQLEYIG